MQENVTDQLIGSLVDSRYLVRSLLARGGMSTVYLATDQRLERDVALKVLHPHLANDPGFLDRLGREAKAAARLSHPHVVGVLDQGEDGHTAYLVMEYIKGHTLRDVLQDKGALSPRLALALIDPVIEGLAAAHAAGLIHRDVKPENVLIADDGRIKVADFGLARAVTSTTSTGALIGTVAYLPPELALGQPADARSDIYSVGIMLYELLTGQQPFQGEVPLQVAYQHVNSVVGPPSSIVPGLAADLDELVQWCTARDPEQRPVDGTALLSELRHIRTSLSDEQLDLQPLNATAVPAPGAGMPSQTAEAGGSGAVGAPMVTEALPGTGQPTQVLSARSYPTEIISRQTQPTAVFPAYPGAVPPPTNDPSGLPASPLPESEPGKVPSKREARRIERQAARDRAKAAATPLRTLREGSSRRRGLIWTGIIVILAVLAATAGWFFGMGPGSPGTVPDVRNKTVAEAQDLLRTAGFQSDTKDVFDDEIGPGRSVGTEPEAGSEIRKFQRVSLFVSKGPELFPLPKLTGLTLDQAKSALNAARMALGPITEHYDEQVPAGTVIAQDPGQDTPSRRGTPVALTVSKGPQPIPVPNVRGLSQDDAVKVLRDAGLKAVIAPETVNDKRVPRGSVVSQSPATGTLTKGSEVTLTVSKGPKMVKVPSYIGKQAAEARRELEKLGFDVKVNNILGGFFGTVRDQDPVDADVPEGSTITLTVV